MREHRETSGKEYAVQRWNYGRRNWDTEDITFSLATALAAESTLVGGGMYRTRVVERHVKTRRSKWVAV